MKDLRAWLFGPRSLRSLHFAVRPGVLAYHLGLLLIPLAALGGVPASVAWATGRADVALTHLAVAAGLATLGVCGRKLGRRRELQHNEALVLTAMVFTIASLGGAIPLTAYGMAPLDAWFEAASGATTTGLSVLEMPVDDAPMGLLFGRAWLQWIGGLGVLVLALALIVTPGASARRMGFGPREMADVAGGTRAHARRVLVVYLALTTLGILGLLLLGASVPDAVMNGFTAISTGGFATHGGSLADFSGRLQGGVLMICFAGAIPFSCYYMTLSRNPRPIVSDPRLQGPILLTLLSVSALVGLRWISGDPESGTRLGDLALTAVSAQTTAGFSSLSMSSLTPAEKLVVIASMFVGGGVGSTAGGIKIFRLLVCLRILTLLIDRISIIRSGRLPLRVEGERVSSDEIQGVVAVVVVYALVIALSWLAFLVHGYDPLDALFEVVSAVGTVGLSTGITSAELPSSLKALLSLDMLMGRIEIIAFLVVLQPSTWLGRRRSF